MGVPRIIHLNRIFHCQGQIDTRSTRCEGITKSRTLVAFGSPASGLKRDVPTYFGLAGIAISSRLVYPKFVSLWISLQTAQCSVDIYIYIFCKKNNQFDFRDDFNPIFDCFIFWHFLSCQLSVPWEEHQHTGVPRHLRVRLKLWYASIN